MFTKITLLLAASQAVTAHFGLTQPQWRADTLAAENEAKYSQWNYPCEPQPCLPACPAFLCFPVFYSNFILTPSFSKPQAPASRTARATRPSGPSTAAPSSWTCTTRGPTSLSTWASAATRQTLT